MDQPFRLEVDDLRDAHVSEAYETRRLELREDPGRVCCPHCGETVGLLVRGNPHRRRSATRTLLVAHLEGPDAETSELRPVEMVVREIRESADRELQAITDRFKEGKGPRASDRLGRRPAKLPR